AAVLSTLVIVAGQSNAVGQNLGPANLPPTVRADPNVRIWRDGRFQTFAPGVNTGGPNTPRAWGPEVEFVRRWRADHPGERLYLVKVAKGSTGVVKDPRAWDWSPASRGEQYDLATRDVQAAKAQLRDLDRVVILWIGGESDTVAPAKAAAHERALSALFARIRSDWWIAGPTIVMARIADEWDRGGPVRGAQTRLGAFSTDHIPMQPDRAHFSAAGQVQLGGAFYEAWKRRAAKR
ncbi:sialate O-acetylesterase, partial [Phenylobacterium sp.]|uniref:sialate O-acetylesterase n=1 Tax=Phenylobacterium sp. TaxID=1871053 RepID=UPI002E3378DB